MTNIDFLFMGRALELAKLGLGTVSPNPMVGCVIVHHDKIIGEGWHKKFGGPHAEVNAIESVKDKSLLPESTVYVTLEPCSHFGKTPPCADLLVHYKVKRVVICNKDINPLVSGKGVEILTRNNIEVIENVLSEKGEEVNKRFFTFFKKQRPFIILKWAQTIDGFLARENHDSKWISNELSRKIVHKWRSEEDAILVGSNTVLYDNPSLNVRDWSGRNPVRIVIDRNLKLSKTHHVFDQQQPTVVYNLQKSIEKHHLTYVKLGAKDFLNEMLFDLYNRKIQSVIIEGGAIVLQEFINARLWDEAKVFVAEKKFDKGIKAPFLKVKPQKLEKLEYDLLEYYRNY